MNHPHIFIGGNELRNTEFSEKGRMFVLGGDLRTHNGAIAEVQSLFSSCDNL